jgi:hypothetical protein
VHIMSNIHRIRVKFDVHRLHLINSGDKNTMVAPSTSLILVCAQVRTHGNIVEGSYEPHRGFHWVLCNKNDSIKKLVLCREQIYVFPIFPWKERQQQRSSWSFKWGSLSINFRHVISGLNYLSLVWWQPNYKSTA